MDHILRDKNENVSSGNLSFSSKTENRSPENLKENYNPKSLLEIASDTTVKLNLEASTPKTSKRSLSLKDNSFQFNNTIDVSYTQVTNNQSVSGLSFLANGLNNLKVTDDAASDDEDQFLSFNDISARQDVDHEVSEDSPQLANVTLVFEDKKSCEDETEAVNHKAENVVNFEEQNYCQDVAMLSFHETKDASDTIGVNKMSEEHNIRSTESKGLAEKNEGSFPVSEDTNFGVPLQQNSPVTKELPQKSLSEESQCSTLKQPSPDVTFEAQVAQNTEKSNLEENLQLNGTFATVKSVETEAVNKESNFDTTFEDPKPIQRRNSQFDATFEDQTPIQRRHSQFDATFEDPKPIQRRYSQSEALTKPAMRDVKQETDFDATFEALKVVELKKEHHFDSTFDAQRADANVTIGNRSFPEMPSFTFELPTNITGRKSFDSNLLSSTESHQLDSTFDKIVPQNNFMESFQPSLDVEFKMPGVPLSRKSVERNALKEEFCSSVAFNFGESDFDFLQKAGSNSSNLNVGRDSVLLRFDPLLERPVPVQQAPSALFNLPEEDEQTTSVNEESHPLSELKEESTASNPVHEFPQLNPNEKDMSVEIMKEIAPENEKQISNLDCEDIKISTIGHHENQDNNKLLELESKMRMEAEQREEVLLKRISEKDKQISKMNNVVKEYEKAIAELIAEKEQLVQSYEKKCEDLKNDSEMNAQHLASLELTFSDLHVKYERTKQTAIDHKEREEKLLQDRNSLVDSLKMQEARYDKMKMHAMSQLESANKTLSDMNRTHQAEVTKLKALLKKEEISRASINEQLIQKTKENAELVEICDELIKNHGNSNAV